MSENIATAPHETVRAGINEAQFFSSLKHLFASSYSMLGELMQNARRAGATRVDFTLDQDERKLTITDDGGGIKDFQDLVVLAKSGWDEQTILAERPFGMGLFSVLFSAAEVTFLSRGKRLTLSLADIVDKRELRVERDEQAPVMGTRIELRNVTEKLLESRQCGFCDLKEFGELANLALFRQLRERAVGFAIPIYLNGNEFPRPLAMENLAGEVIDIGFVSIKGIHRDRDERIAAQSYHTHCVYLLQGLPIGAPSALQPAGGPGIVVHLDNACFTAKMPDRSHLFDAQEAGAKITSALKSLVAAFLENRKATMAPRDFVAVHWEDCVEHGLLHLMNDVPWIPASDFHQVGCIQENHENMTGSLVPPKVAQNAGQPYLISKDDVEQGRVIIWRNTPNGPSETPAAALLLKVMQLQDVLALSRRLPEGHWINSCTPDADQFVIDVQVNNPRGEASFDTWDWTSGCDIRLADEVVVTIGTGSGVDPLTVRIVDNWVLLPADFAEQGFGDSVDHGSFRAVCFLVGANFNSYDHPVGALSSYTDEHDQYRDDWQDSAERRWDSVVAGLVGGSIAGLVRTALANSDVIASEVHLPHMAVVKTTRTWLPDGKLTPPSMNVVCLQEEAFWDSFAQLFDAAQADSVKERLKQALTAAVKPGEALGQPPQGEV